MASLVRFRYGLPGCLPPCTDRTGSSALGDFYFQAFNGSVALSVAGYNYNSGWISFCWRDLHPLEWQLASLHGQIATMACPRRVRFYPDSGLNEETRTRPVEACWRFVAVFYATSYPPETP